MEATVPEATTEGEQANSDDELSTARHLIADGMYEGAERLLSQLWLKDRDNLEIISTYMILMKECGRSEQAAKIKKLLQLLAGVSPDGRDQDTGESGDGFDQDEIDEEKRLPYAYFEAGFSLIDARQFELAIMLLNTCNELQPNDPIVNYELGFALMSLSRFKEAILHFEDALKITADFDTVLNLSVCHVLTRNLGRAKELTVRLTGLASDSDETREANHRKTVLKRLELLSAKKTLNTQDWLFILYGGILLSQKEHKGKVEEHKDIAEILLLLKGLLEGLRLEVEIIEYYNAQSRPLAKIFSELMELPMDSYKGPNRPENCLLIMDWATDLIGPHEAFIDNSEKRIIFAYALSNSEPLPVMPDIVGCLVDEPLMPWEPKTREETLQNLCLKITNKARDLEADPDIITAIQDLISYFESKKRDIVIHNPKFFPERPEYSAEIQSS